MMTIDELNAKLAGSGSNLNVFYDPYNNHNVTVQCTRGGTDYLVAKTFCETAEEAEAYIERHMDELRAAAGHWGAHLTRAEELEAEDD